jgi:hypothetical protein|tara:strand:+ start:371 stop:538 length:168 start_codon:yes stop_codon:yes gene_type:complete
MSEQHEKIINSLLGQLQKANGEKINMQIQIDNLNAELSALKKVEEEKDTTEKSEE